MKIQQIISKKADLWLTCEVMNKQITLLYRQISEEHTAMSFALTFSLWKNIFLLKLLRSHYQSVFQLPTDYVRETVTSGDPKQVNTFEVQMGNAEFWKLGINFK